MNADRASMKSLHGLIVAAGLSRRMGEFKPLLPLRGRTVIENTVDSMLDAGVGGVTVVLGHRAAEVEAVLSACYSARQVQTLRNARYGETDMLASVRIGLAALPPCRAFYLLPGDMPFVARETYWALARAFAAGDERIVFPQLDGRRGHPPLIGGAFARAIEAYDGPDGLRGFWQTQPERIIAVPVADAGCMQDLDTPQQYRQCLEQLDQYESSPKEGTAWKTSPGL